MNQLPKYTRSVTEGIASRWSLLSSLHAAAAVPGCDLMLQLEVWLCCQICKSKSEQACTKVAECDMLSHLLPVSVVSCV